MREPAPLSQIAFAVKPGQSECLRCERLFVFFYRTNRPVYCRPCVEIERQEHQAFHIGLRYRDRLLRMREETRMA